MVWNVQGTGKKEKINAIKEVVRTYKPTVLALVETHMGEDHAIKLGSILGYKGQSRVNAIGFSGGIWLYWNTERDPSNRRNLWSELETFARNNNRPWMLAGDFNETRSLNKRHGGDSNMARRCENFNNWIENCELLELAFSGSAHTWARGNSVETRKSARLDRALCNADWGALFEDAMTKHLPAIQSDHCPIFIAPNGFAPLNAVNRPFRFQACWLTHESFKEYVDANWPSVMRNLGSSFPKIRPKIRGSQFVSASVLRRRRT
ncbi:uncharacterized protein LOC141608393 [Silene latifolia]|uniref:uncharacterized protein LOC141608393 n=1 Tax=Silene latifolia TaxID=37657 RepID=UPI003D77194D